MTTARDKVARRFRGQARSCEELGSPLYAALLDRAAGDIEGGGATWQVLAPFADLPGGGLLSLRFMGSTHRLALRGDAPELAAHYPSCGGDGDLQGAWRALHDLAGRAAETGELASLLPRGVQTNEVGRCAALLGGFLDAARSSGLPLRILEVGASAGLNLRWDRFRYEASGLSWGPAESPVDQGDPWAAGASRSGLERSAASRPELEPAAADLEIVERRGCDLNPLDPASSDGRLTLLSFVWPDMARRFRLLDAACEVAVGLAVTVDQASADSWLAARLAADRLGSATVVFHSIVLQYLSPQVRERLVTTLASAGREATTAAPLSWLRLEPAGALGSPEFEVRLTTWPGGEDRRLALAHPHGTWVRWDA